MACCCLVLLPFPTVILPFVPYLTICLPLFYTHCHFTALYPTLFPVGLLLHTPVIHPSHCSQTFPTAPSPQVPLWCLPLPYFVGLLLFCCYTPTHVVIVMVPLIPPPYLPTTTFVTLHSSTTGSTLISSPPLPFGSLRSFAWLRVILYLYAFYVIGHSMPPRVMLARRI